jgi:hypothetical protein
MRAREEHIRNSTSRMKEMGRRGTNLGRVSVRGHATKTYRRNDSINCGHHDMSQVLAMIDFLR